jgi:hypothetical protein|nr:MAG TPA: hypothetical protein [Caudoviricetes sp.]
MGVIMSDINALVPRQRLFDGVPTSVPFTYRDGLTTLQLIECLRHNLDALQTYVDKVKEWVKSEYDKTDVEISEINEHLASVDVQLEDIISKLGKLEITNDIYDVTQGRYVNSVDAMRNMYRELAVFGARVNQMAQLSVPMASAHSCLEFAVLGNKTIFHNNEPRITPRDAHVDDGEPVNPLTVENLANGVVVNHFMKTAQ